ncbi:hypothetical protein CN934_00375 [Ensifer sp. MMN_5]|nr:hypothetical protein CN934_00375 [Ensifer sp. MMN_5]PND28573.1 hypothetical protein CN933_00375 [Sinorhizobium sp. M4_45]
MVWLNSRDEHRNKGPRCAATTTFACEYAREESTCDADQLYGRHLARVRRAAPRALTPASRSVSSRPWGAPRRRGRRRRCSRRTEW